MSMRWALRSPWAPEPQVLALVRHDAGSTVGVSSPAGTPRGRGGWSPILPSRISPAAVWAAGQRR